MVDAIEALRNIGVQDVLILALDTFEDSHDGIVTGPSWSESVAVGLKPRLPSLSFIDSALISGERVALVRVGKAIIGLLVVRLPISLNANSVVPLTYFN